MDSRLYRTGLVLLVTILGASTIQAQQVSDSQRWRDSLTVLNRQIAESQWSTDLHLRKATANLELKQWEYAIDEYALVLQHEPRNPAALFYRAYANTHLRRFDLARNDLNDLLIMFPSHFEGRLSLAVVLQQQGHHQDALDQLNQAIEQHADSAVAYAARANLERVMKQDESALYDWQRAEELSPRDPIYVVSHVDLLLVLERREEARRVLDAAVRRGIPRGMLQEWYQKTKR
ncbi:MAG: tetratricopeptide repeat protein [Prevotella sp.]|nr:tetratricopeptide repeat protein [Prevotella sp.]MBQ5547636.1 tetratricopeptide repeat protein [Prevotella sp.]